MAGGSKASRRDQASIEFRWVPIDAASPDLRDNCNEGNIPTVSNSNKQSSKHPIHKSPDPEILSTQQLVSAIGKVWDCANRPVPFFWSKASVEPNECHSKDALHYTGWGRSKAGTASFDGFHLDPNCAKHYYDMVNSSFECIDIAQRTSSLEFCSRLGKHSLFRRYALFGYSYQSVESWKVNGLARLGISFDLGSLYERITENSSLEPKHPVHMNQIECKKPGEIRSNANIDCADTRCTGYGTNMTKLEDSLLGNILDSAQSEKKSLTSLHSDHSLDPLMNTKATSAVSNILTSEYHSDSRHLDNCVTGKSEDILQNENMINTSESIFEDVPAKVLCSDKLKHALPNKGHAFAGALSGTFVSLCLHPVDTIKTVTQSQSMAEKSIIGVMRSIISDRGVTGLYRGIASNIASSAPISAVYTYTYESVKGALLPLLPKEYHSVAHCMAGGCASIATSFIFTPSERIKQQMQVGSHYQNSWAALVGILGKGGFSSLYAGWGAVLCRNIPHSIIKFYTYETLKQVFLSTAQSNARPSTYQTLICGGLAGSTAALFTTPFDVVKTRLQTQIPGSSSRYDGVFHALQEISKHEGLKGLYRGLTPRLIMYISQGALFFSSYEFFKGIFSLEIRQICGPEIQDKKNTVDESPSSSSALTTSSVPGP